MKTLDSEIDPYFFGILHLLNKKLNPEGGDAEIEKLAENILEFYQNSKINYSEISHEELTINTYNSLAYGFVEGIHYFLGDKRIN